jgi:tRNA(fMet)-specific endonuclease VapC
LSPADVKVATIVEAELLYGAAKSSEPKRTRSIVEAFLHPFERVPFGKEAAEHYAAIRAALEKRGKPIGPNDLILAATVLAGGGTLVTHDIREFRRVPRLSIEDWAR